MEELPIDEEQLKINLKELNPNEKQVLKALIFPYSQKNLAEKINMPFDTLRSHAKKVYQKLLLNGHQYIIYHRHTITKLLEGK